METESETPPEVAEKRHLVGDGVEQESTPHYGASGGQQQEEEEVVVVEEEPQTRAARGFFDDLTPSYYSIFEYCCKGNLVKIIIGLLISTIILFVSTIILLTMVIMYATNQIGCNSGENASAGEMSPT